MKQLETVKAWLSLPTIVVSCLVALGVLIAAFGFRVQSPAKQVELITTQINQHIMDEQSFHVNQTNKLDSTTSHTEHVETLIESLLRGECLENPRENLVRQGLIKKCQELGINR